MEKQKLIGSSLAELENLIITLGQPRYRADQLFNWLYKRQITSFTEMTNFSKYFRNQLTDIATIPVVVLERAIHSSDKKTYKFLFRLEDGQCIESVFMNEGKRRTVCLSSQVGCALNCDFCATGKMGFKRNLNPGEIVDQLLFMQRYMQSDVTNVVIMGMGEPFLNYHNVLQACDIISHDKGIAIGKRKITISTSGIIPAIKRFADEGRKYKLAISLNAATDKIRDQLMPINKKYPIGELINAAKYYFAKTKMRITFEYVLIKGLTDGRANALKLKNLVQGLPCKINIIPYNETQKNIIERPKKMSMILLSLFLI